MFKTVLNLFMLIYLRGEVLVTLPLTRVDDGARQVNLETDLGVTVIVRNAPGELLVGSGVSDESFPLRLRGLVPPGELSII